MPEDGKTQVYINTHYTNTPSIYCSLTILCDIRSKSRSRDLAKMQPTKNNRIECNLD